MEEAPFWCLFFVRIICNGFRAKPMPISSDFICSFDSVSSEIGDKVTYGRIAWYHFWKWIKPNWDLVAIHF
jgi:hypothetical protein